MNRRPDCAGQDHSPTATTEKFQDTSRSCHAGGIYSAKELSYGFSAMFTASATVAALRARGLPVDLTTDHTVYPAGPIFWI